MAARLTRARKKLALAGVPFALPTPERVAERIDVVATVAYLAFTAGYAPGSGPDVVRAELAGEAIRLTRLLRQLLQGYAAQPPTAGTLLDALLALMLLQHSRRDARVDAAGLVVLLPDQDRARWHHDEIAEAFDLIARLTDGSVVLDAHASEVLLQALIAAEHARAASAAATDWPRIATLYAALERLAPSPAVRLARAVAVAEAEGAEAGLSLVEGLAAGLPRSHRLPAIRAELLMRAGRNDEARAAYDLAISLCANDAERAHLAARRAVLA